MPKRIRLHLTEPQIEQLTRIRDTDKRAYLRERAGAILKIDEGISPHQVALRGLLKKRDPDTVYTWVHRFIEAGVSGLTIKEGRGRKPAFFPSPSN
jgi:transposase